MRSPTSVVAGAGLSTTVFPAKGRGHIGSEPERVVPRLDGEDHAQGA